MQLWNRTSRPTLINYIYYLFSFWYTKYFMGWLFLQWANVSHRLHNMHQRIIVSLPLFACKWIITKWIAGIQDDGFPLCIQTSKHYPIMNLGNIITRTTLFMTYITGMVQYTCKYSNSWFYLCIRIVVSSKQMRIKNFMNHEI